MKKLLAALGLSETATEDEGIIALNKLKADSFAIVANRAVLAILGVSDSASESEVTGTIMAMKQSHTQVASLQTELNTIKMANAEREATELVTNSMRPDEKGMVKVSPAMKDWALAYAKRDPEGFRVYINKAPGVISTEKIAGDDKGGGSGGQQLDETELQVCKAFGNKPEDVMKNKAAA